MYEEGERWHEKRRRLRSSSSYGQLKTWDLRSVIVKAGDDCRQELMAVQLVGHFKEIFEECRVPAWLYHYEVLVVSSQMAMIETVLDATSIHSLKAKLAPSGMSLRDHFKAKFPKKPLGDGRLSFSQAQHNFVESMAAYSLLTYILQVRRQAALLLILRQKPARSSQAHRRSLGLHLRRM